MDPNAALQIIREACQTYDATTDAETANNAAGDVVTFFMSMDEWLTNGGFLPDAWRTDGSYV